MDVILSIKNLNKVYAGGLQALKNVSLEVRKGEIFALLGPNGAGKTTLINMICGIVTLTDGEILVNGHDINEDFRSTRALIGLVPQELFVESFEPVWETVSFSRGLFGHAANPEYIERILKKLSLWDKRDSRMMTLSGGMKRRVMIAKALSHEPQLLFLDEPTAGVDVELRKRMWDQVKELRDLGVTIILTTHYIDEAEEIADRIGVINNGEIVVIEDKKVLMKKFGRKQLIFDLKDPLKIIPGELSQWDLGLKEEGTKISYTYDLSKDDNEISQLLIDLCKAQILFKDIHVDQRSLEEIFIQLVEKK